MNAKTSVWLGRLSLVWESLGSLVFFLLCFDLDENFDDLYFHTFMRRDMDRALELLHGHWIFFGPETSGGGYLPGPLFYFILMPALWWAPVWQSCFWLLIDFFFVASLATWHFVRKRYDLATAFFAIALLTYSHPLRSFVLLFLNVSYLLPLALIGLLSATLAYSSEDAKKRDQCLLWTAGLIGLGLQLHYSILCLLLGMVFLQFLAPRQGLLKPRGRMWIWAIVLILAPCLPYVIWKVLLQMGWQVGQSGTFIGQAPGSLTTLLMLANYSTKVPWQVTLRESSLRVLSATPFVVFALWLTFLTSWLYSKWTGSPFPRSGRTDEQRRQSRALVWLCVWAFLPFSYVFLVHMGRRYGMVFTFAVILLTLDLWQRCLEVRRHVRLLAFFASLLSAISLWLFLRHGRIAEQFIFSELLMALFPLPFLYGYLRREARYPLATSISLVASILLIIIQYFVISPRGLREKEVPRFRRSNYEKIWSSIYSQTGWDYETAIQHIYFVNLRLDEDPRPVYEDVVNASPRPTQVDPPDGFFVLNAKNLMATKRIETYYAFFLAQRLPEEIKAAVRTGEILWDKPQHSGILVIPYHVPKPQTVPRTFHDLGEGYTRSEDSRQLDQIQGSSGTLALGPRQWMFKWNECPNQEAFCNAGAVVKWKVETPGKMRFTVRVVGSALAQNSPWISPSFTQAWIDPYLEVRCEGPFRKYIIFSSIGLKRQYGSNEFNELLQSNNSIVAPFEREFSVPCFGPVQEIAIGRVASEVEKLTESVRLPGQRLTVRLDQ